MRLRACSALPLLLTLACGPSLDDYEDTGSSDSFVDDNTGGDGATDGGSGTTDGADGGSDGADGSDGTDGTEEFAPAEGHWTVIGGEETYNNCDVSDEELPAGDPEGFQLVVNSPTSFTWTFDSSGDSTTCDLAPDGSFSCSQMSGSESVPDINMTIGSTIDIVGSYTSETALTSTWDVAIDCTAGDCWLADLVGIDLPCDFGMTVQATRD